MSKNRVESFSDGVFAIVITLLILNVHLDRQQALTLDALRNLDPDVFAFILTFVIVGVYWISLDQSCGSPFTLAQPLFAARGCIRPVSGRVAGSASWQPDRCHPVWGELDGGECGRHGALALCRIPPPFDDREHIRADRALRRAVAFRADCGLCGRG
jgi:hypothetical protein